MKPSEASMLAGMIAAGYPGRRITDATVMMYAAALSDLPYAAAAEAVSAWILSEPEWPSIADLRRTIFQAMGNAVPDVDQAWGEIKSEVSRVGSRGEPRWSHPAIAEAVRYFGWTTLCQSDNEVASRAHFFKIYQSTAKRSADKRNTGAAGALAASVGRLLSLGGRSEPVPALPDTTDRKRR